MTFSSDPFVFLLKKNKQTPWPLVHKQTIPTEGPPLVGKFGFLSAGQKQKFGIWFCVGVKIHLWH
jgi:hypothetical protein